MNANWYNNLTTYWSKIEEETQQTLRLVRDDFQRCGMSLNSKFKDDFVQETKKRIAQTFDQFLNQNPIIETTAAVNKEDGVIASQPVVESIPDEVHDPGNESMERATVNTAELAHELVQSRSTTDPIAAEHETCTAICPQGSPTLIPFLDTIEECETNPPFCPTLQTIDSFVNESIGPNDDTPTIDAMLGNASKLIPQSDQSQTNETNKSETESGANTFSTMNSHAAMPPDATGPEFSRLDDIILMDVLQFESTKIDLPTDAIANEVVILDIEQATSAARVNESTNQLTECLVTHCEDEDVQQSLEVTRDHIERNASEQEVRNQQRKRKNTDATTSDGIAKKRRKTGLTTMKTIPELISDDLVLSGSCHEGGSTSSQPEEDFALSGTGKQNASTLNVKQVAKKKVGSGRSAGKIGLKEHKCAFCEYAAVSESVLIIHTRKHTGDKPFTCEVCTKTFSHAGILKTHMMVHSTEKPFKCKVCAKGFKSDQNLRIHMTIHAKDFSFHCSICLQGFNEEKTKKAHEKSCKRRRHECYLCKFSSLQKKKLFMHMCTHTGDKPFKCEVCAKGFSAGQTLRNHMKIHAKDFSFHCRICLQGFDEEKTKKAHETSCKRHRHECYLCKLSTLIKRNLVEHMRNHIDKEPYCCSHCSKQFNRKSNLDAHLRRFHDEAK